MYIDIYAYTTFPVMNGLWHGFTHMIPLIFHYYYSTTIVGIISRFHQYSTVGRNIIPSGNL